MANDLPPVIQILLSEKMPEKPGDFEKYFRRLIPEIRSQAEWTLGNYDYADSLEAPANEITFNVTPVAALDPLSGTGICAMPDCRVQAALKFAQTLGLYSDKIFLVDILTAGALEWRAKRWSSKLELGRFAIDLLVLRVLRPLIEAGIVQFRRPSAQLCDIHYKEFLRRVHQISDPIIDEMGKDLNVETVGSEVLSINTGDLHDPPLHYHILLSNRYRKELQSGHRSPQEIGKEAFVDLIQTEVNSALLGTVSATNTRSVVMSNSRLYMAGIMELNRPMLVNRGLKDWEMSRSGSLPWIGELTPSQIVQLRSEAATALPRFRARVARSLCIDDGQSEDMATRQETLIVELNEEAEEVAAELKALSVPAERRFHSVVGILGLGFSIYGLAENLVTPGTAAVGSLLSVLSLIHSPLKKDEQDERKLMSRPGFVFVKAREILSHAPHK